MQFKRVLLFSGHYGSGKTNIAINIAMKLKETNEHVTVADIDIVNPYFRTSDSSAVLKNAGIRLICSEFAGSNVDLPALPSSIYSLTDDRKQRAVIDVGGDDRGALALGRLRDSLLRENDYEMFFVFNCYRPLTKTPEQAIEVMREIEMAGKMKFTSVINNSNLGDETLSEDVLSSVHYANEVCKLSNLPLKMTTVNEKLFSQLQNSGIDNLFPLSLQSKIR